MKTLKSTDHNLNRQFFVFWFCKRFSKGLSITDTRLFKKLKGFVLMLLSLAQETTIELGERDNR